MSLNIISSSYGTLNEALLKSIEFCSGLSLENTVMKYEASCSRCFIICVGWSNIILVTGLPGTPGCSSSHDVSRHGAFSFRRSGNLVGFNPGKLS